MQFVVLEKIVAELSHCLRGAVVKKVVQDGAGVYLVLRQRRDDYYLLLSPERADPRLHLVSLKPHADGGVHGFTLYLRSHLPGAALSGISIINDDRIVEFCFKQEEEQCRVVMELIGTRTNLFLLDSTGVIKSVYYPVPGQNQDRALLPGVVYEPPPKKGFAVFEKSETVAADNLIGFEENKRVEKIYAAQRDDRLLSVLRNDIARNLKKTLAKVRRRKESLIRDMIPADKAEEFRKTGDLILANLNRFKRGADEAFLTGYDGESISIKLDPKRSPGRNAEQYFKKYKKAKSGRIVINERLEQARKEEECLESLLAEVAGAQNQDRLEEMKARIQGSPVTVSLPKRKQEDQVRMPSFRKTVFQGWEILIGRSAAGNDYVSTKLARDRDLWLHAEGMPGAHVLIRNPADTEIPPEVLLKAASFAAFYSRGRGSGKVPVAYTRAANVKKTKGTKPGSVFLSERKSIMAVPEEIT